MSQKLTCRYPDYEVPEQAWKIKQFWILICEQFGLPWCRNVKEFEIVTDHPQILLDKTLAFARPGAGQDYEAATKFQPVSWTVSSDSTGLQIEMRVRELKTAPILRGLDSLKQDSQVIWAIIVSEAIIFSVAFTIYAIAAFPEPAAFWEWIADHVRVGLGAGFAVIVLTAGASLGRRYSGSNFAETVIIFTTTVSLGLILIFWFVLCPERAPSESYVSYLGDLRAGVLTSLFISVTPWLALILKTLGLDVFGSTATVAAQQLKPPGKGP